MQDAMARLLPASSELLVQRIRRRARRNVAQGQLHVLFELGDKVGVLVTHVVPDAVTL